MGGPFLALLTSLGVPIMDRKFIECCPMPPVVNRAAPANWLTSIGLEVMK